MIKNEETLREQLRRDHPEYQKLSEEHRRLDEEIKDIFQRKVLTPEDEIYRKKLQVEKLHAKDKMEAILRERRRSGETLPGSSC